MDEKDSKPIEAKVVLRRLTLEDFDALVAMQEESFPGMRPWLREQIASQLEIFPEGQFAIDVGAVGDRDSRAVPAHQLEVALDVHRLPRDAAVLQHALGQFAQVAIRTGVERHFPGAAHRESPLLRCSCGLYRRTSPGTAGRVKTG